MVVVSLISPKSHHHVKVVLIDGGMLFDRRFESVINCIVINYSATLIFFLQCHRSTIVLISLMIQKPTILSAN